MKKVLLIIILLITRVLMSQTDVEINSYYQEISSKSEYGIKKEKCKFLKDVKIFVQGNPDDTMNFELNKIISELDTIIEKIKFSVTDNKDSANIFIYFGTKDEYSKINKTASPYLENNYGLFLSHHLNGEIKKSYIFIDMERTSKNNVRKHLLREELTQSLGLGNDSNKYPDSIFYQDWSTVTSYSKLDIEIIKQHYR